MPEVRRQHMSSVGRRLLAEVGEFTLENVSDAGLVLWSGCVADCEPIIEVREIVWRYPGGDDPMGDEPEETRHTRGWLDVSQVRELLDALDDPMPRPETELHAPTLRASGERP